MALVWHGEQIKQTVQGVLINGLNEYGGRWELAAKRSIGPGRGVITGTYRRSLHYASPSYNFGNDNVPPSNGSPERAGGGGGAEASKTKVSIMVGSGMVYARRLEQLYNVVMGAHAAVAPQLPAIFEKHARQAGLT